MPSLSEAGVADRGSGEKATESPTRSRDATDSDASWMTDGEFAAAVSAVTAAFGDPTRRQIYLYLREQDDGATATAVASHFELHPNVARHHLDKLAGAGYLDVVVPRSAGSAGRPSKLYRVSPEVTGIEPPKRDDDLLINLLGKALSLLPPDQAEKMAEEVGEEYGRDLAARIGPTSRSARDHQRSLRAALHAIAEALTAHGFAAHAQGKGKSLTLYREACPFFDAAVGHPVICAVDRGMVRGMLTGLYGDAVLATESSRALGDEACATFVS